MPGLTIETWHSTGCGELRFVLSHPFARSRERMGHGSPFLAPHISRRRPERHLLRSDHDLRRLHTYVPDIHLGHDLNCPRYLRRLHDGLRQAAEERTPRFLVAFLAVGIAVAHA